MFAIPLFIFLGLYILFLVFFLIFSAANVYHIYSTGTFTFPAVLITVIVSLWCLTVLGITFLAISGVDWQAEFVIFGSNILRGGAGSGLSF